MPTCTLNDSESIKLTCCVGSISLFDFAFTSCRSYFGFCKLHRRCPTPYRAPAEPGHCGSATAFADAAKGPSPFH